MDTHRCDRGARSRRAWPRSRPVALALLTAGLAACRDAPSAPATPSAPVADARAPVAARPPREFVERLTAGARADQPLPLIIVVHGLGDRPEAFVRLFDDLPFPARVVAPRTPTTHGRGYSWFPVREIPPRPDDEAMLRGIRAATTRLAALARWLASHRPTTGRPVVTGFSQGGILSFALAAAHPDAIAAAIPIAGALPPALHPEGGPTAPVFALHGEADPVVPIAWARTTVAAFEGAGGRATLRRYPGVGHHVPPPMRADLTALLRHTIAPTTP